MISTVITSLILVKKRSMMEVFSPRLRKIWKDWELRGLVLFSLLLQILLVLLGNRRRYIPGLWIRVIVWCAYLLADSVATLGLGNLSSDLGHIYDDLGGDFDSSNEVTAFWAPFLLLHLGGPDTITAYSLEDATLWLRRFFELLTQTTMAVYIFLMAWNGSGLSILTIPIFIVGLMKYVERTLTLWKANSDELSGNYGTFKVFTKLSFKRHLDEISPGEDDEIIFAAHGLLHYFKLMVLFADLLLNKQDVRHCHSLMGSSRWSAHPAETAFDIIATELGFMYDLLYTKAKVIYTPWGLASRFLTFSLTSSVLLIFTFGPDKSKYKKVDVHITFLLLAIAILMEIYAALILLFSYQTRCWLIKRRRRDNLKLVKTFKPLFEIPRWSGLMAQCSLLGINVKEKPGFQLLGLYRYVSYSKVTPDLRSLIFDHVPKDLTQKIESLEQRLEMIVRKHNVKHPPEYIKEFNLNILMWHIATELCYYVDEQNHTESDCQSKSSSREVSLSISRYLVYLLVFYPFMLPIGISFINFRELLAHTRRISGNLPHSSDICKISGEMEQKLDNMWRKSIRFNSVIIGQGIREKKALEQGCMLSRKLDEMSDKNINYWDFIRDVWLEMLVYAAQQPKGRNHAQQLRRGGELLTHVWLLCAHFGIPSQFQRTSNPV